MLYLLKASVLVLCLILPVARSFPSRAHDVGDENLWQQVVQGPIAPSNATYKSVVVAENYTRHALSFGCEGGVQCSGWLYTPSAAAAVATTTSSSKPPVVVMGHGLGGEKPQLDRQAAYFASAGFAVLTFDYRYWGQSEGEPRRWTSPPQQIDDWLSAIKHVQEQLSSQVDTSKLSIWGSSFGGGHVITVASKLGSQIKAVVSQVPHLDGKLASSVSMMHRGMKGNTVLSLASLADSAADKSGTNFYVPLAGPPGSVAIMQLDGDEMNAYCDYKGLPHTTTDGETTTEAWRRYVVRASLATELRTRPYSPTDFIKDVTAPILIVAGIKDSLCPFPAAVLAATKAHNATLLPFNGLHFDIYNAPVLYETLAKELGFLKKYGV